MASPGRQVPGGNAVSFAPNAAHCQQELRDGPPAAHNLGPGVRENRRRSVDSIR